MQKGGMSPELAFDLGREIEQLKIERRQDVKYLKRRLKNADRRIKELEAEVERLRGAAGAKAGERQTSADAGGNDMISQAARDSGKTPAEIMAEYYYGAPPEGQKGKDEEELKEKRPSIGETVAAYRGRDED